MNATWKVTSRIWLNWNSLHADAYQCVVYPAGSQLRSQRVENELAITVAIMAKRLRTKNPTTTHTVVAQIFAPMVVSRIIPQPFPPDVAPR